MTSSVLFKKFEQSQFLSEAFYLGISLNSNLKKEFKYVDLEKFFLKATYNLTSSRVTEGFLCWLKNYGHLLSPSKVRRLISSGEDYNSAVLGVFTDFLILECLNGHQFKILQPFSKKLEQECFLYSSPKINNPNTLFLEYNVIAHNYMLDENKFLLPKKHVYKTCVELKNRALFGSTVNADVASFLFYEPSAGPYKISKKTFNHKASVYRVYSDVQEAAG